MPPAGPRRSLAFQACAARLLAACWLLTCVGCTPAETPPENAGKSTLKTAPLTLLVVDDPVLTQAIRRLRTEWLATTGSKLTVVDATSAAASSKPKGDALILPSQELGAWVEADRLLPLPLEVMDDAEVEWSDILETVRTREVQWAGETWAVPLGSPVLTCFYRRDLFAQAARKPPETWDEYREAAEYFADHPPDEPPAADTSQGSGQIQGWHAALEPLNERWRAPLLLARAAAYAKHRDQYSDLFDVESLEPLVASPPFVRALRDLCQLHARTTQDHQDWSPKNVLHAFLTGHSALALAWPLPSDAELARLGISDARIGIVPLPGSTEVYHAGQKHWETRPSEEPRNVTLLGLAGRLGVVRKSCAHPELAWRLLTWIASPKWSTRTCAASDATAIFRASQAKSLSAWTHLPPKASREYFGALRMALADVPVMFAPRIPAADEYLAALDTAVASALSGTVDVEPALLATSETWREITKQRGQDRQRAALRRALGLEP